MKVKVQERTEKEFEVNSFHWCVKSDRKVFSLSYKAGLMPNYTEFFTIRINELPILIDLLSALNQALLNKEVEIKDAGN